MTYTYLDTSSGAVVRGLTQDDFSVSGRYAAGLEKESIAGIPTQDMAMWESMGPIVDRSSDYLGASDVAVSQFRRQMVAAAKRFAGGGPAIGTTQPHIPPVKLASFEGIVAKSTDWRTLGVSEEELALREETSAPALTA